MEEGESEGHLVVWKVERMVWMGGGGREGGVVGVEVG